MTDLGTFPDHVEAGLLTPEEMDKIRADARAKVLEEIRAKAVKLAMEESVRAERIAAGLEVPDEAEEIVEITLTLPESVAPWPALVVDGRAYYEGTPYKVPRKQAIYLYHMAAAAWTNQHRYEGRWVDTRKPKNTVINPTGPALNAPQSLR